MSDKQKLYEVIKNLHNQVVIGNFNEKSYCTLLYQLMTNGLISQEMGIDLYHMARHENYCTCSQMDYYLKGEENE